VPVDLDRTYVYDDDVEVRAFLVDVASAWEPTLNEEHDDYRWCRSEDAAALFRWPETKELVRAL
jgi:8-oxo-dGTP pyrophosphatase MutT (NUDIX family)